MSESQPSPQDTTPKPASSKAAFGIVAVVLLIAAVSLNAATQYLQLNFQKRAVPLRKQLTTLPAKLGHWVQVSTDEALNEDLEHGLGTKLYIFRDYVDTRIVPQSVLDQFKDKPLMERKQLAMQLQLKDPRAVVNIAVTYYTGLVDTVAHIPDRCYIADGYEPTQYDLRKWDAFNGVSGRDANYDVRFITFEDQTPNRMSIPRNVAYVFNCNGIFSSDPLGVRQRLADLRQKYGYYAKVELMSIDPNRVQAESSMSDLLGNALPGIQACLPDWDAVMTQSHVRN